ncbi:secretory glycoprotein k5-like protein [Schistosoma japonicum]|nr:secretory glycoprotein k5-like protein [Schistosoma japonicum]
MAEKPEINLTLYESAKTIRATEKEFQVKWALDYLNEHAQNGRLSITLFEMYYLNLLNSVVYAEAANDTWKLEKNQFVNTTNSYLRKFRSPNCQLSLTCLTDKNNSIVRDSFCKLSSDYINKSHPSIRHCFTDRTSLLNESNARNWNETIQKTVNYGECDGLLFVVESPHSFVLSTSTGCTVLNKYTEWKWKNRTELDLLAIVGFRLSQPLCPITFIVPTSEFHSGHPHLNKLFTKL